MSVITIIAITGLRCPIIATGIAIPLYTNAKKTFCRTALKNLSEREKESGSGEEPPLECARRGQETSWGPPTPRHFGQGMTNADIKAVKALLKPYCSAMSPCSQNMRLQKIPALYRQNKNYRYKSTDDTTRKNLRGTKETQANAPVFKALSRNRSPIYRPVRCRRRISRP